MYKSFFLFGEAVKKKAARKANKAPFFGSYAETNSGYPQRRTLSTCAFLSGVAGRAAKSVAFAAEVWYTRSMQELQTLLYEGETGKKFAEFYAMLCAANEKFNLTAITEREECYLKHFADSLSGERFFPHGATCAEVGSGGGFPSVPLMIVRPDLDFALFESSEKKCGFLRESCAALGLRAQVYHLRAEEAGRGKFRARFDVCCARAVARLNTLAEYCLPLVRRGGRFIAYKGRAEEELAEAASALRILGARVETLYSFELPEQAGERTVCVFEKYQETPAAYPRGRGKERSKPL